MYGIPCPPNKILRVTAENTLRGLNCAPTAQSGGVCGQWWAAPWGGPSFFIQWDGPNQEFVDEGQLRHAMEDIARYKPLNSNNNH